MKATRLPPPLTLAFLPLFFLGLALSAHAQLADGFNPAPDDGVEAVAIWPDGSMVVGGYFMHLAGETHWRLGRLSAEGVLDADFNPGTGPYVVNALALQTDGKILVKGLFTTLAGQPCNGFGRLNADGTFDFTFRNPATNGTYPLGYLGLQPDGKILVSHYCTNFCDLPGFCVARLNSDGTPDPTFTPAPVRGCDYGAVNCAAFQTDRKIVLGGCFTNVCGQPCMNLARLNSDGILDTTFNSRANYPVYCLVVQPDGRIVPGGVFTQLCGQPRNSLGRLNPDGSLDPSFIVEGSGTPWSLALQADGRILVHRRGTAGIDSYRIIRLYPSGAIDHSFDAEISNYVDSLALQADGKLLVGGSFWSLGGAARSYFGRLNNTEPATQALGIEGSTITWLRGGASPEVWQTRFDASTNGMDWIALGPGERIFGGWQCTGLSLPPNSTIRARGWVSGAHYNRSCWFVETMIGPPAISLHPASRTNNAGTTAVFKVLAGGNPSLSHQWLKDERELGEGGNVSGVQTPTLTLTGVLRADAGDYRVVISNASGIATSLVAVLTVLDPAINRQPTNQLVNVGQPTVLQVLAAGTPPVSYQWRQDGAELPRQTQPALTLTNVQWTNRGSYDVVVRNQFGAVTSAVALLTVNMAPPDAFRPFLQGMPIAIALQRDGKILVASQWSEVSEPSRYYFERLNVDGTLDPSFNPLASIETAVSCLAVLPDNKILVAGDFLSIGGQSRRCIARLYSDGSLDPSFTAEPGSSISCMAAQPDSKIVVGGWFSELGGTPHNRIGRFNADGSVDTNFNAYADRVVYRLALQADGKILVAGEFTNLCGFPRWHFGRLNSDGTVDESFDPGMGGFDTYINAIVVQPDGKILLGGSFTNLAGQARHRLGRLNPDGTLDTSFNPAANWTIYSLTLQADGKILVGGYLTTLNGEPRQYIGRLNPDGTLDPLFNPSASYAVISLALQADGMVLASGYFWMLAGQIRGGFGRLYNTEPATQSLVADSTTLTWLRGGASPEVVRATFECSTNGSDWFILCPGTRIPGGWQLSGAPLPANCALRALGIVVQESESWVVDAYLGRPVIHLTDGSFGFYSNQFSFNLSGPAGQNIIVEGSADLVRWNPLLTNTLGPSPLWFSEPGSTNIPGRFYRARLP